MHPPVSGDHNTGPSALPRHLARRVLVAATVLSLTLSAVIGSASAQDEPPTTTEWQDPVLVITATAPGGPTLTDTPGAPSGGPRFYCGWFAIDIAGTDITGRHVPDPVVGDTYLFHCWSTHPWVDPYPGYPIIAVFDPAVDPPGPLVTTPEVARFALDSIEFERPAIATSPADVHVVGVPSWFAVESALDYPTASAQAGPVWATVRPVFRHVEWTFADGARLVCTIDATTQWHPDHQPSNCRHTFTTLSGASGIGGTTSDGLRTMPATATVSWTVWERTDRTAGAWRRWGEISLTATADLPLVELQAAIN